MDDPSTVPHWYLFDYGMVISTAPEPEDWEALQEAAGLPLEDRNSSYWLHRHGFDSGALTPQDYWTRVLGREITDGLTSRLEALDACQWSHLNAETLDVLDDLHLRGARLALLSNMPAGMAEQYTRSSPWAGYFDQLFFSGHLGLAKPDPQLFRDVIQQLGTTPAHVTFVDDVQENLDAATALGIQTVLHSPGINLSAELGL
ncbi:HAD family phosphatase [Paeniglutamicibacter antarcticus]|uniref:HAD family phosphatase n=1 Tax=Arthrobacter terrae TaxID=2935737 RepID=A0A931CS92_9MICC|nr:HAD family phosphatase [Arthrobacter terrae]MBG0741500.1 HAD family phosphatase [Arthrobacter terrae]